ncbi:MAG: hypothetical protein Q4D51_01740 [Eubacteriales bacterium]|nr:hypothetical protein [Eubacteriales bacterium]
MINYDASGWKILDDEFGAFCYEAEKLAMVVRADGEWLDDDEDVYSAYMELYAMQYLLFVGQKKDCVCLSFYSKNKQTRALEFLRDVMPESGLVKGTAIHASGEITFVMLQALMVDEDFSDWKLYFQYRSECYFRDCQVVDSEAYAKQYQDEILMYPRYVKRTDGWSFVRTVDIADAGQQIRIKTLENETGIVIVAAEDLYIMIGVRGEIYDITAQRFQDTYIETGEAFDLFARMTDYIPAAELVESGEYISLDEYAYVCYPKPQAGIYVKRLEQRTKVFQKRRGEDYFYGAKGDYLAIRPDDFTDIYIIQADVFEATYEEERL